MYQKKIGSLDKNGNIEQDKYDEYKDKFEAAICDDLNTSMAITVLYDMLKADISDATKYALSESFDEANFLFGIKGQTVESVKKDIELGLKYFERICINIMCENSTSVKPDKELISAFIKEIYPIYKDNDRTDILINNTDFGVGD